MSKLSHGFYPARCCRQRRQRVGQVVRDVARAAGITSGSIRTLRYTVATRLLALGIDITDPQRFLGHESIATPRLYAETTAATLQRKMVSAFGRSRKVRSAHFSASS